MEIITLYHVGDAIAPESDIAVFNMLGYKFRHADYVGRGVIEAIGIGTDFKDGDLALRGNFATLDENGVITDRRAGRNIEKKDALTVAKELEEKIKLSEQGASVLVLPTIGHRVTVIIKVDGKNLSSNNGNSKSCRRFSTYRQMSSDWRITRGSTNCKTSKRVYRTVNPHTR